MTFRVKLNGQIIRTNLSAEDALREFLMLKTKPICNFVTHRNDVDIEEENSEELI